MQLSVLIEGDSERFQKESEGGYIRQIQTKGIRNV